MVMWPDRRRQVRGEFSGLVYREMITMKTLVVCRVFGIMPRSPRLVHPACAAGGSSGTVMGTLGVAIVTLLGLVMALGMAAPAQAGGVVGDGTSASCTAAAYNGAMAGGGLVTFNCGPAPVTIGVYTEVITTAVTIDGGGLVTLSGENLRQLFLVQNGGTLNLRNITLSRGKFNSGGAIYNSVGGTVDLYKVRIELSTAESTLPLNGGGAIYNLGTLRIDQSFLGNNLAYRLGGALFNSGTATVRNSSLTSNRASAGGAIWHSSGTLVLEGVSVIGNKAESLGPAIPREGGGIYSFATIIITNTTFRTNIADTGGGLYLANGSTTSLLNVTINENRANLGGGIFNNFATAANLKNTIVANSWERNNPVASLNCDGPSITSQGNNIIGDGSCFSGLPSDKKNTNPLLNPLADNGGPTLTFMPQAGSPAINAGSNTGCPARDQRGASRPFGSACDIGSVEFGTYPPSLWLPVVTRS